MDENIPIECNNVSCRECVDGKCATTPKFDAQVWVKNKAVVYCLTYKFRSEHLEKLR